MSPHNGTMDHDTELENPPPNEELYITKLTDLLTNIVLETYPPGKTLRDAHPKQHGTVAAQFIVEPDLPAELRVGVFSGPATYDAFIRFSNANPTVSADYRRDVRGMAIKLIGVKGKKLLEDSGDTSTNDFVLISYDVFLTRGVQQMYEFTEAYEAGPCTSCGFGSIHLSLIFESFGISSCHFAGRRARSICSITA